MAERVLVVVSYETHSKAPPYPQRLLKEVLNNLEYIFYRKKKVEVTVVQGEHVDRVLEVLSEMPYSETDLVDPDYYPERGFRWVSTKSA